MSTTSPAQEIEGEATGNCCDRCNRSLRNEDGARFYATRYEETGWTLRRVYCADCGELSVIPGTEGADEVVGEAVFFDHMLAAVRIIDRSHPNECGPR